MRWLRRGVQRGACVGRQLGRAVAAQTQRPPVLGFPPMVPVAVKGVAYGILPGLWGEAHGIVGVAGAGEVTVPIVAAAAGEVDVWLDDAELALLLMIAA